MADGGPNWQHRRRRAGGEIVVADVAAAKGVDVCEDERECEDVVARAGEIVGVEDVERDRGWRMQIGAYGHKKLALASLYPPS